MRHASLALHGFRLFCTGYVGRIRCPLPNALRELGRQNRRPCHTNPERDDDCVKLGAVWQWLPPEQEGLCRRHRPGPLAVGFLCLSAAWSLDPQATFRVAIVYLFVMLGVIGIARTMDADEYMHLLSRCCFLAAIASILLLVASPSNALTVTSSDTAGDFVGIFTQKNVLGQVMATGALATLHGIRVARQRYLGKLCMLFLFVGMAYASKSTGALLAVLLFCGISGFDSLWRKRGAARLTGVILAVLLAPVIILAVIAPDTLLELVGKDPTLTGRTEIWAYVIADIWMKPWLGWGYFAFWQL